MKIGCSRCFLESGCKYDGGDNKDKLPSRALGNLEVVKICPEIAGRLPVPRSGARIVGGDGYDVLDGRARVITDDGKDVTQNFITGARAELKKLVAQGITKVLLKQGSPSCGKGITQGGDAKRMIIPGTGVAAALFLRNGINVVTEADYAEGEDVEITVDD